MAEFNLVQAVFDRSALSLTEDVAVCTMHIRKHIAFAPDVGPITGTERTDFTNKFTTFFNAIKGNISAAIKLRELRYYDVPSGPGIDMGPAARVDTLNLVGTSGGNALPPQVALSVTFRTDVRKHWGRFYLPGLTVTQIGAAGRVNSATTAAVAAAAAPLCNRGGTGANLTVFSRLEWRDHDVTLVQVDDIADVIRRRRFSAPTVRSTASP